MNMQIMTTQVKAFLKDEEGLTTVEYAIAGSLVGAAVVTAFTDLGSQVRTVIDGLTTNIGGTPSSSTPSP
ncbi:Flp family type IVb pilin [Aliamphritea spongicola]|uniref:Flp family type IVb pilin n=1 Tax=Aliamphritea spongicola TaxID=707589 RepID=UPI001FB029C2|nr:pilus assembly protein [Aliamphritea spongicola]